MERKKNVAEIKRLIQEKKGNLSSNALFRFLIGKGISKILSEEIVEEFVQKQEELSSLQQILAKRIRTSKKDPDISSKKIAFIGPYGSGKTTLVLKLARLFTNQSKKSAVMSLESEKLKEQILKCYIKQIPEAVFIEKEEPFEEYDHLLVDTPSCSFFEESQIEALGEMVSTLNGVDLILTLNAASKEEDLYAAIHQFSPLRPAGFAFTKMDETLTSGCLINVLAKTDLPVYFVSWGSSLDGEIFCADPNKITHKILTHLNEEKYQDLRHMALIE